MTPEAATNLHRAGRLAEAEVAWRQVLARHPGDPQALGMLGTLAWQTGRTAEACDLLLQSLRRRPDAGLFHNLGLALRDLGQPIASLDSFGEAVALQPGFADAHAGRGLVLLDLGFASEAEKAYARAESLHPADPEIASGRLLTMQYLDLPPPALTEAHRATASRLFGSVVAARPAAARRSDPLRVGFVSGDLRTHPVGLLLEDVAAHLPGRGITPVFFPTHASQARDPVAAALRAAGEWIPLEALGDDDAAGRVRAAGVDLLVDLSGHTGHHRLGVFARRPAPVQATWLGYTATTGLPAIDAILCDPAALPDTDRDQYVETPWRLPARLCFTPPADAPDPRPPPDAGGAVTFGCFNNVAKVGPRVVATWAALLHRVPRARLLFKGRQLAHAKVRQALADAFAARGIAPERLAFEGFSPRGREYWSAYAALDVALDPFPFNGGTTTLDTLWMGVPVVSMRGKRMAARQGESILGALGLDAWLAADADDYVAIAAALADDREALARFRGEARARLRRSVMADPARYAAGWAESAVALHRRFTGGG